MFSKSELRDVVQRLNAIPSISKFSKEIRLQVGARMALDEKLGEANWSPEAVRKMCYQMKKGTLERKGIETDENGVMTAFYYKF